MSIKKAVTRAVAAVVVAVCAFANANAETNFYEYVEAGGAKYNTGYFPNASSVISFKGMFAERKKSETNTKLFAAYRNGDSVATQVGIKDGSGCSLSVSCWTRGSSACLGSLDNIVEGWACMLTGVISNTTRKCVINGQSLDMSSVETGNTWAPELALHGSASSTYSSKTRLYYVSISEGGLPVHDYRPCSVDGVAGYFDLVTGTFVGNSNFTIGGNRLYRLTAVAETTEERLSLVLEDLFCHTL